MENKPFRNNVAKSGYVNFYSYFLLVRSQSKNMKALSQHSRGRGFESKDNERNE